MTETNINLAKAYYETLGAKDSASMGKYLHPEVKFISPLAQMTGKESVLEAAKNLFKIFEKLDIRALFGNEDQAMVALDMHCPEPIGVFRTASLLTFQEGLITRIELFYDTKPLEKKEIFSASKEV